jgi:2,3-diaminopropionate biosynthesis protein SbnA
MIVDDPQALLFTDVFLRLRGILRATEVVLKLEGFSITGSIKIKTAKYLIADIETRGLATPGKTTLVESSSGNLGVALSFLCRRLGYRFVCVTDPHASRVNLRAMDAYGAEIVVVDQPDQNGGYVHSRLLYIENLLRDPSYVWLNQYANPANISAHAETTASEILAAFPAPDYVILGAGSTGTLMGCARRFREASPRTRLVAVDPEGSISFGGRSGRRVIAGIGSSRRPELLDTDVVDHVVSVPEADTIRMCHEVVHNHGILIGGSTGTVLAAARTLEGVIEPGASVIAVSADFGDKYLDTIYDRLWVQENFGFDPRAALAR